LGWEISLDRNRYENKTIKLWSFLDSRFKKYFFVNTCIEKPKYFDEMLFLDFVFSFS